MFNTALSDTLTSVCEAINWDYGEAWIPQKDTMYLELAPSYYINQRRNIFYISAIQQFRLCSENFILQAGDGLPGRVWVSKQSEWIVDVSSQSEAYFLRNQMAKAFNIKAGFAVPVLANYEVLAVLSFFASQEYDEDKQVVELATTAATKLSAIAT